MADRYEMPPEGFELEPLGQPAPRPAAPAPSRYTQPPAGFALEPLPGTPAPKPPPSIPAGQLTGMQVAKSAYEHLIPSAIKTGKELVQPFIHPQETFEGVKTIGAGLASKAGLGKSPEGEAALGAIKDYYVNRYGGLEEAKRAFAEDPVGVASDVAALVTGGGGALKGAGKIAEMGGLARTAAGLGKAGEVVGEAGRIVDPVTATAGLTSMAATPITKGVVPAILSFKSGKTMKSLQEAEEAGATSNPHFWRHWSGEGKPEEVIDAVKGSMDKVKEERKNNYLNSSQGWKSNQAQLDLMPAIDTHLDRLMEYSPSGRTALYMKDPMKDISDTLHYYGGSNKTMSDFDLLKRDLDKLYNSPNFRGNPEAQAALTSVRNKVWQTIVDHDPKYAEIMKNYEDATKEINAITAEVGTNKAAATTRLKKLIKASDKGTIDRLIKENPNLPYMIAGQELSSLMPEGLRGALLSSVPYSMAALGGYPAALAGLAAASPKIAGAMQYGIGAARELPVQVEKMALPTSVRRATMLAEQPYIEPEGRATGGSTPSAPALPSSGKVMTAEMMISKSKQARKKRQAQTKVILDQPDEHVVKALKVASDTLNESDNG